jgi:hypothetical protein
MSTELTLFSDRKSDVGYFRAVSAQSGNNILATCLPMTEEDLIPKVKEWCQKNPGIEANICEVVDVWKGAVHVIRID